MFKRATLLGSQELFRPTRGEVSEELSDSPAGADHQDGILLEDAEIRLLVGALQQVKYPERLQPGTKLPLERFNALENLRQKLVSHLDS